MAAAAGQPAQADAPPAAEWDDALLFEVAVDPFQKIAASGKADGRTAGLRDGYRDGVALGRSKGWELGLELGYMRNFAGEILEGCDIRPGGQRGVAASSTSDASTSDASTSDASTSHARTSSHRLVRCLTLARDIVKLVDQFPDPDALLSQSNTDGSEDTNVSDEVCKSVASISMGDGGDDTAHNNQCSAKSSGGLCCNDTDDGASNDGLSLQKDSETSRSNPAVQLDVSASMERIRAKFKLLCVLLKTGQSFELKKILDMGKETAAGGDERAIGANTKRPQNDTEFVDGSARDAKQKNESVVEANAEELVDRTGSASNAIESDW